jgi:hypothetical protein
MFSRLEVGVSEYITELDEQSEFSELTERVELKEVFFNLFTDLND